MFRAIKNMITPMIEEKEEINIKNNSVEREYLVSTVKDERCLNGDENCPCYKKPSKRDFNPV